MNFAKTTKLQEKQAEKRAFKESKELAKKLKVEETLFNR